MKITVHALPQPGLWFVLAALSLGAAGGAFYGRDTAAASESTYSHVDQIGQIMAAMERRHVTPLPPSDLAYAAVRGMTSALDPHSSFLEPESYSEMQERQEGMFYGIGVVISVRNGRIAVISPVEGTPAHRLGLRAGDILHSVDGQSLEGLSLNQVVHRLRGAKGTKVKVRVEREGVDEPLEFEIERVEMPTVSVPYKFMVSETAGLVRLSDFNRNTTKELADAVEALRKQGMKELILDLRDNPGGLLQQAVEVAEFFLEEGQMVVYMKGRGPASREEFHARRSSPIRNMPVVVLINRASASASEIVAGAIQDHDRGIVVGERSWGKGLVQSVYSLRDGSGLALTTAKYYTPSGRLIQRDYDDFDRYFFDGWNNEDSDDYRNPALRVNTDHGRPVYGGGGIMPDVVSKVPEDPSMLAELRSKALLFRFGAQYAAKHPNLRGDNWQAGESVLREFRSFAEKHGAAYEDALWEQHGGIIGQNLEREVLTATAGLEEANRAGARYDTQVQDALKQMPNAQALVEGRVGDAVQNLAQLQPISQQ